MQQSARVSRIQILISFQNWHPHSLVMIKLERVRCTAISVFNNDLWWSAPFLKRLLNAYSIETNCLITLHRVNYAQQATKMNGTKCTKKLLPASHHLRCCLNLLPSITITQTFHDFKWISMQLIQLKYSLRTSFALLNTAETWRLSITRFLAIPLKLMWTSTESTLRHANRLFFVYSEILFRWVLNNWWVMMYWVFFDIDIIW